MKTLVWLMTEKLGSSMQQVPTNDTKSVMQLLGSTTSPYVRRIRMLLGDHDYEFINLDIFTEQDRALLTRANPANRVPALIDGEQTIIDSGVIFQYLTEKFSLPRLNWHQRNQLALIDAVNDSLVSMLILSRSDIDTTQDKLFFNLQRERAHTVYKTLDEAAQTGDFEQWNYLTMSLYCLLDWVKFRSLFDCEQYQHLAAIYQKFQTHRDVQSTDPRS